MNKDRSSWHALHWIDERQESSSLRNLCCVPCCKRESVQLQFLPNSSEYLKGLLTRTDAQGRYFKDNLRQYNTTFAFTSLGCDIVSHEKRAINPNNRGGLDAFQVHGALCHCQGPLIPVEDNAPSYVQLHIYNLSYAPQRRSERNENLVHESIGNLSGMLAQCSPFANICHRAYEILSNHESSSINSEDGSNDDDSTKAAHPTLSSALGWGWG